MPNQKLKFTLQAVVRADQPAGSVGRQPDKHGVKDA
jgi:hypothetical protein